MAKDPDHHGHVCEWCGDAFTHHKSEIVRGMGLEAHVCPGCHKPVNTRVELKDMPPGKVTKEWYGVSGAAKVQEGGSRGRKS